MRNERITYEDQYQGHPIITDKDRQLGCKESILQKIDQIMTDMSNRHSKVFFMRYDVRFPQGYGHPNDNELFSQLQESFIKNRKRAGYDPAYIAVRECSRDYPWKSGPTGTRSTSWTEAIPTIPTPPRIRVPMQSTPLLCTACPSDSRT